MTGRRGRPGERGSVGLLAVGAAAVVLAVALGGVVLGGALVARHRAGRTADLAALAAASATLSGAGDGCAAALRVARLAQAELASCAVLADRSVLVVVAVPLPPVRLLGGLLDMPPARARARAGASS